jgi:hypothetical protein
VTSCPPALLASVSGAPRPGRTGMMPPMHDSVTCLVEEHLPLLLRAAGEISADFARLESVPHVTRASTH